MCSRSNSRRTAGLAGIDARFGTPKELGFLFLVSLIQTPYSSFCLCLVGVDHCRLPLIFRVTVEAMLGASGKSRLRFMTKSSKFRRHRVWCRCSQEYRLCCLCTRMHLCSPHTRIKRRTTPDQHLMRRATYTPFRLGHGASDVVMKLQKGCDSAFVCGNSNMD